MIIAILSQGYSLADRLRFLIVHMMQMELLLVFLTTSLMAYWLYGAFQKQNGKLAEQKLARNVAAAYIAITLVLLLAGRVFR